MYNANTLYSLNSGHKHSFTGVLDCFQEVCAKFADTELIKTDPSSPIPSFAVLPCRASLRICLYQAETLLR